MKTDMRPDLLRLSLFKSALWRAWNINLYRPDPTAPIPGHIWRRIGAE